MSDLASFKPDDIMSVWGSYKYCAITNRTDHVEYHHIIGRGGKNNRKMCSSLFNCIPIHHEIHTTGYLKQLEPAFLDIAAEKVIQAYQNGEYIMKDHDVQFLELIGSPYAKHLA